MELKVYDNFNDFKNNFLNSLSGSTEPLEILRVYLALYREVKEEYEDKINVAGVFMRRHNVEKETGVILTHEEMMELLKPTLKFSTNIVLAEKLAEKQFDFEGHSELCRPYFAQLKKIIKFLKAKIEKAEDLHIFSNKQNATYQLLEPTAAPVDAEPDNREQEMFRKSAKQYDDSLFLSNEASEFVYCVLSRFEEEIRNKATKTSHVNWIFDRCCNNIDKDLKKVPGIFRPVTKAEFLKKFSTSVQKTFDSIGQRDKREQIFMEEYNAMLLKID